MNCSWGNKHISSYLNEELHDNERDRLEAHLVDCQACSRKLEELRAVQSLFKNPVLNKAPADFATNVMAQLHDRQTGAWWLQPFLVRFAEGVVILLVISIGLASGGMLSDAIAPKQAGTAVMAGLTLDSLKPLPTGSLAHAYLRVTEVQP